MKMNKWLPFAASILTCLVFQLTGFGIRDDFPTFFDEDTLFYLEIPNVTQIQEDWEENPYNELYQREEVKEFVDALLEPLQKNFLEFGENFEEEDKEIIEELLKGQIAIGVSRLDILSMIPNPMAPHDPTVKNERPAPNFWAIFTYENEDLLQKMIDEMEEDEDEFVEYGGFYIILTEDMVEMFNEEFFALTNNEETAKLLIDRFHSESSQSSLADTESFQRGYLRLYEGSEIFYYIDLRFIAELAEQAAEKYEPIYTGMIQQGQLAPAPNVLEALGLDALQGITGSLDTDPSELRYRSLFMAQSNDGFFGRMLGHHGNSLPDTSFLSEELSQAVATSYNISGMLHDLEHMIAAVSPMAGQMYFMQKTQFEDSLSIPINGALIDNFSGSVYMASGQTPNTAVTEVPADMAGMESFLNQGNTYIIGINDRISLEALVDSLLATFNQQENVTKQDYLGVSNYTINSPVPTPGPTFFVSDQHLIVEQTNPDFGKLVVSMMQNPGQPIFERRDVRDAINELPGDPVGVNYTDAEKLLVTFSTTLSKFLPMLAEKNATKTGTDDAGDAYPMERLSDVPIIEDFKYFTLATTYIEDDDLYQEGIMRPKTD